MKTKNGKKITGIRTAIQDMRNDYGRGFIAFCEETGEVWYTDNYNVTTPTLKYEVENEKELKYYLKKQFGCVD